MDKKQIMQYLEYIKSYNIRNDEDVKNISKLINQIAIDYDIKVEKLQKLQLAWKMSDKKDKESFKNKEIELFESLKLEKETLVYFGHKYSQMKMNIKPPVNIVIEKNKSLSGSDAFFELSKWSITYDVTSPDITSACILGTVFHEMRHAKQNEYISSYRSDINFDPIFIVIAKEKILRIYKLLDYENNHENFISENDANLYGKSLLEEFSRKFLNGLYDLDEIQNAFNKSEQTNFSNYMNGELMNDGDDISYNNKNDNNRIILTDKKLMELIRENPRIINNYPILKYVYNINGTKKAYQEIIKDRNGLLEKHKDNNLLNDAYSYSEYNYGSKSEKEQIDTIYKIIISSDPLLWVEDCINKNAYKRIYDMLDNNDVIVKEYRSEFINLIKKYPNIDKKVIKKINDILGITSTYSSMLDELDQNQQITASNEIRINTEEINTLIPEDVNELLINFANSRHEEIIDYDKLSYEEKYEQEEMIRERIHPKINEYIKELQKWYLGELKKNPEFGYEDLFAYMYPNEKIDTTEVIEKKETVEGHKQGYK